MIQIPTTMIISLLALGLGYIVLYLANKSEGFSKSLGKAIAAVIIILSAFALIMDFVIGIIIISRARSMSRGQVMQQQQMNRQPPPPAPRAR